METRAVPSSGDPSTTTVRDCPLNRDGARPVDTGSLSSDALFLAGEIFTCADDVVVVGEDDPIELAVAAQLAAALEAPLLFPNTRLAAEIGRLKPRTVHLVGAVDVVTPPSARLTTHDTISAGQAAAEALGVSRQDQIPSQPGSSVVVETVTAIEGRDRVTIPTISTTTTDPIETNVQVAEIVTRLARPSSAKEVWIVDANSPSTVLWASAMGSNVGAAVVPIDGADLFGHSAVAEALAGRSGEDIRLIGPGMGTGVWELSVLANGVQLPGGGFRVLPMEHKRRYVAFYGHPETDGLGVLGEQGPEETLERLRPFLDAYRGDGSQTVPTFELIVSVASASPTADGDYSYEWPVSAFEEWIDVARRNDVYVVLDLQPGREDFLSQAMFYEELLRLPFVGLALDPEWRLGPDQVHLRQVGRVDASEVNRVIHWLADLVRENGLPQKMLIVHQFKTSMIQNRQDLESRPELQLIIQMDGDGTEAQKNNTFDRLKIGAEDAFWSWGWKNFFDEDEPGPPTPASTMDKDPSPVYVSYQ